MTRRLALATALVATAACAPAQQTVRTTYHRAPHADEHASTFDAKGFDRERALRELAAVRVGRASRSRPRVSHSFRATGADLLPPTGFAPVSWYARGSRTASGSAFNPDGLTFAHLSMPFGTRVHFCHDGRCVVATCTDRGPAGWTGRTFDLSRAAFAAIADLSSGVVTVSWEVVE